MMNVVLRNIEFDEIDQFVNDVFCYELSAPDQALASVIRPDNKSDMSGREEGIFLNDKHVGVVTSGLKTSSQGEPTFHISLLFILPTYRGLGIGSRFLALLKERVDTKFISAHPFTEDAEAFFIRNGFLCNEDFHREDTNTVVCSVLK